MARESTPAVRSLAQKKHVGSVRRKYKKDLTVPRKLLPGEEPYVADMVVVLKLAGYTYGQIGSVLGISKGQVKKFLDKTDVVEKLTLLREALPAAALELLHGYMIEAVQTIVDVMRKSTDDKFVLQAAAEILDRGGIPKASRQERLQETNEQITITDDGILEKLRDSSPEIQEKAAQAIEQIENLLLEAAAEPVTDEENEESA
jgi:hypothetical protein